MFAKVMREFSMDFDAVLNLPLKRFWFLVGQIDRLRAEVDLRQLHILAAAGSADGLTNASENLRTEIGHVFVWIEPNPTEIRINEQTGLDPEFDMKGLLELKQMASQKVGSIA